MVTLRIELDERTAERLRKHAERAGLTLEDLAAETLREQAENDESGFVEAHRAKALKYGLEPDDPLLDLIGLMGNASDDAVAATKDALDDFYRNHLDSPR